MLLGRGRECEFTAEPGRGCDGMKRGRRHALRKVLKKISRVGDPDT